MELLKFRDYGCRNLFIEVAGGTEGINVFRRSGGRYLHLYVDMEDAYLGDVMEAFQEQKEPYEEHLLKWINKAPQAKTKLDIGGFFENWVGEEDDEWFTFKLKSSVVAVLLEKIFENREVEHYRLGIHYGAPKICFPLIDEEGQEAALDVFRETVNRLHKKHEKIQERHLSTDY